MFKFVLCCDIYMGPAISCVSGLQLQDSEYMNSVEHTSHGGLGAFILRTKSHFLDLYICNACHHCMTGVSSSPYMVIHYQSSSHQF